MSINLTELADCIFEVIFPSEGGPVFCATDLFHWMNCCTSVI